MNSDEDVRASRRGRGFMSAAAGLWIPGLGHWIAGKRNRAIGWFAAICGLQFLGFKLMASPATTPALIVLLPIGWIAGLALLIDSYLVGRRSERYPSNPAGRYGMGLGMLVLAAVVNPFVLAALVFRAYVAEAFIMPTQSMSPTTEPRDRFLVHKREKLQRWSVVAFYGPEEPSQKWCKRIVGLPGEQVELFGDKVYINGAPIALPPGPSASPRSRAPIVFTTAWKWSNTAASQPTAASSETKKRSAEYSSPRGVSALRMRPDASSRPRIASTSARLSRCASASRPMGPSR
jgi:hypothetical protein